MHKRFVTKNNINDDLSDNITFFHALFDQALWSWHDLRQYFTFTSVRNGFGIATLP